MGINKSQKFVFVLVMIILLIFIWALFPLFFKWLMIGIGTDKTNLEDFGALGDIYGSLNTLFTSATLIIVIYSAYLQRQANKDAREAMAKQLEMARVSMVEQIKQARTSTAEQLNQAKSSTAQQLALARSSHDAQMQESKYAIFSSMFNILLNQKDAVLEKCGWGKEKFEPNKYFSFIAQDFERLLQGELKDYDIHDESTEEQINYDLILTMDKITDLFSFDELTSYFYMLVPLINLIKNSTIKSSDKATYFSVISNSMTYSEQVTLLWFTAISHDFQELLKDTHLLNAHFDEGFAEFIKNNFDQSIFGHPRTLAYWD
ncbi:putative phage abortive infection protein [Acinetobacter nosocomialis]|uniref:putative phage abortive infection protein n=1 Tax=Acinetobacter nosocomialis TaxID=106654 RepID=UPI000D0B22C0|nr:putative phage abortive infection protein [Acinetobacter nosocomialis]MDQ8906561.1 putative phage abortive infection protein [Acinetobacter nosocomialis]PSE97314.1 hypothetical protein C7G75_01580 [Acinetobacter nosocomialis]